MFVGSMLIAGYLFAQSLPTASVVLAWDASPDASVSGYRLYYGVASRTYTNTVDVGNVLTGVISNLVPGVTYYFAATAYATNGLESDFSNEVGYTVPLPRTALSEPSLFLMDAPTNGPPPGTPMLLLEDPTTNAPPK